VRSFGELPTYITQSSVPTPSAMMVAREPEVMSTLRFVQTRELKTVDPLEDVTILCHHLESFLREIILGVIPIQRFTFIIR
jgi:hypothetical protein